MLGLSTIAGWLGKGKTEARSESRVNARYENAQTTSENSRAWWAVDALSSRAANSFNVRRTLRMRSRYEFSNNPFLFGICMGNAGDLISSGPTLQVRTSKEKFNRQAETRWREWCHEVDLVGKLRTAKLAKTVDGEGFLVLKTVEDMESPVKLYPCDLEADQVTTPAPLTLTQFWVDGLELHPVTGKPKSYHVLKNHPGDFFFPNMNPLAVDKINARYVLHWFDQFRPGQARGIPTFTSSLDLFTELRAFRKAVVRGAETAADFAAVLEQEMSLAVTDDDEGPDELAAFKKVPISRAMMVALPPGAKMSQFKPEQPTTNYQMFAEACLGEAVRPMGYPLNLALGSSQKFNFSSSKLDHINYRNNLKDERKLCEVAVLRRLFIAWYEEAVLVGAVDAYDGLNVPPFEWHWPGFQSLDPLLDAQADAANIAAGLLTLQDYWAQKGKDWREVLSQLSEEKKAMEKEGLVFGDVVTRTISETSTDVPEAANAA